MMTQKRRKLLQHLAEYIAAIEVNHAVRVAIDGVDTSGKTTLANELAEPLEALGRPVIRSSVDGFHRTRQERYAIGKDSPVGYYLDSFNNQAVVEKLLQPLGQSKPAYYETAIFDFKKDRVNRSEPKTAVPGSVLLFDGVFLMRPELNPFWDVRVFLHVPLEEVLRRAEIRDKEFFGSEFRSKYHIRYIPGQKLYLQSVQPEKLADIIIDNSDFNDPRIIQIRH